MTQKIKDNFKQSIQDFDLLYKLLSKQESLEEDFQKVLDDNMYNLYENNNRTD